MKQNKSQINEYQLRLDSHLLSDYKIFRDATSKDFKYKKEYYRCVYLGSSDYAIVNIICEEVEVSLIVNLEFYYTYGFIIDGEHYAFNGEALKALKKAGFDIPENNVISYGDAYYDIGTKTILEKVREEKVTIDVIKNAVISISDKTKSWDSKREDILRAFWALVEGIRFNYISEIVAGLIEGEEIDITYDHFYFMAERWAKMSVGAAHLQKEDSAIAVFELHRLGIPQWD